MRKKKVLNVYSTLFIAIYLAFSSVDIYAEVTKMPTTNNAYWGSDIISLLKNKDSKFKKAWNEIVEETKKSEGEDFDITQVYPPRADQIIFSKPEPNCSKLLLETEKEYKILFPGSYKEFLCQEGSLVLEESYGNQYFRLLSASFSQDKSKLILGDFIERYKGPDYECYSDQIPLLSRGVVFAISQLRGSDEYDVYFFASDKPGEFAKIYRVEMKEGVVDGLFGDIKEFLQKMASDINDLDDIL
ncbi:MAG: hypothetical protein P8179_07490 [Candidatus Thiodiazotropha sp.]|jgi:hypothetical protein